MGYDLWNGITRFFHQEVRRGAGQKKVQRLPPGVPEPEPNEARAVSEKPPRRPKGQHSSPFPALRSYPQLI
jgi:hypothetical protein